jgi:hydroxyethylthiazole kinase-like uncharacterized protein yjeF
MGTPTLSLESLEGFPLPPLSGRADKDSRGRALVVGGGAWGPGAPLLSALAVLRSGAGKLQIAVAERFATSLAVAIPEAAVLALPATREGELSRSAARKLQDLATRNDAIVVGPGILDAEAGAALAVALVRAPCEAALVVDAGALTALDAETPLRGKEGRVVLTPHAGEMARLVGCDKDLVVADPLGVARDVARRTKSVVVMKGPQTFVVGPDGQAYHHRDGVIGLATSGSGDVLAGLIGRLLAQGAAPLTAAAWGVCVHGEAGRRCARDLGETGFLARELLVELPRIIRRPA